MYFAVHVFSRCPFSDLDSRHQQDRHRQVSETRERAERPPRPFVPHVPCSEGTYAMLMWLFGSLLYDLEAQYANYSLKFFKALPLHFDRL